jgi:hypothetical protein
MRTLSYKEKGYLLIYIGEYPHLQVGEERRQCWRQEEMDSKK